MPKSKSSLWWRGPSFLFDKSQSYTKSNFCENKETLPDSFTREFERQIKNEVISSKVEYLPINTLDNIIGIKGYSDVVKLFRVTALVIRFVKNLFRKVKGDNLNLNSYVDAKEICKAKDHWVKANQVRLLKSDNYEHLKKNLSLKFDKENIIRCYGRLENKTENKHPIMLPRNHDLTKLLVLKCHEIVLHNGVKQTLNELRYEFWINRGGNYIQKLLNICFICKRLQSRSYSYPKKPNLPGYRVNCTAPLQVCVVDTLGPVFVKDIYHSSNDEIHKAYIALFTCSTSTAIILDLVEDNNSKNFINSIKKFIARRGCPKNIVSDNGKVFTSQENQSFCAEQGIAWKFNLDGAPWWGGFWERLVGMVKSCLKKSIGMGKLSFTELLTVLFEVENVLNNRPLCFVTPNCLLYGRILDHENKIVEEIDFGIVEGSDLWERKLRCKMFSNILVGMVSRIFKLSTRTKL